MQLQYTVSEWHTRISFVPDCVIAYGGDADFESIAKQISALPEKPYYITIPAFLGTYSHVMPLSDGNFPDMTIVDSDVMRRSPENVKMALSRALDALSSEKATEYSDSMAIRAVQRLLNAQDCSAEQLANAGTLTGFAFWNADAEKNQYTGHENLCAQKLGTETELLIEQLKAVADKFNF
jgi:alcohol dehydrogenase class IV